MALSVFDMFRVGIGPSSSHTVGPMRAGCSFVGKLRAKNLIDEVSRVEVELMGSLAATGKGHGTDTAAQLGLMGESPEGCRPDEAQEKLTSVEKNENLLLGGLKPIKFYPGKDIIFNSARVPDFHTNGVDFKAYDAAGEKLFSQRYYSVGGGFIVEGQQADPEKPVVPKAAQAANDVRPYPFHTAAELLEMAQSSNLTIAELMFKNECAMRPEKEVNEKLDHIWEVMKQSMDRGLKQTEPLPGPFKIARRAKKLMDEVTSPEHGFDPLAVLDYVNAYAIAVSEENAAGGRVVTAPTNGAAGVVPAVIQYYLKHTQHSTKEGVRTFLLTAGAIGMLYKENASISGAEVGCQGEVGVACSMAAAGLAAVRGGNSAQIENAAEIGMEHNLGLTCDPVAGQVQIPCIERNAIAAVKAINAARMALRGDGSHYVSLDKVIRTMYETGRDMQSKYKETSEGGLAVNIVEC